MNTLRRALQLLPAGLRRPLTVSLAAHLLLLVAVSVLARPRFVVPKRIDAIPVTLIAAPAPGGGQMARSNPSPPKPPPATTQKEPAPRGLKPDRKKADKPAEKKPPEKAPAQPARPKTGSADSSRVVQSGLPAVGDMSGVMQMRAEGELLPYSYYLQVVHQKIASYWEAPVGLERSAGEVAAVIWFRIERDGRVASRYVEEPSGSNFFDTSALRAVDLAEPLPPLPDEYPGQYLIIHLRFVYSR